jgi:membrane associated rhomboid family serine protease
MEIENNQKPLLGADNNALVALLAINLVGYVILGLIKVVYYLESLPLEQYAAQIFQPLTLTSNWLKSPWSILTYNWVHDGFWILFANMIWLSVFSYTLQLKAANKHIFPIYFYSGIMGALVYLIMGYNQPIFGAGPSVTGITIAVITLFPNYKLLPNLYGGLPIWILGMIYLLLQGYFLLDANIATDIVTLVGGLTGAVYVMLLKRGKDLGKWMHQLLNLLNNSLAPKN